MKGLQKVTKVQLKVDHDDEIIILGLVSAEPDYKLSLTLNRKLGISLRNTNPLSVKGRKQAEENFSRFSEGPDSLYSLVSNRNGSSCLVARLRNIDYFLAIRDPEKETNVTSISDKIREISSVTAVFNIDINTIRDKNLKYLIQ